MSAVTAPGPAPLFHAVEIDFDVPANTSAWPASVPWATVPWGTLGMADPIAAATSTLRLSDHGYVSDSAVVYQPLVAQAFAVDRRLPLSPAAGTTQSAWGGITINNPGGTLSSTLNGTANDHTPVRIYIGRKTIDPVRNILIDPAASDLLPMFSGLGRSWRPDRTTITIDLLDLTYWLSMPIRPGTYGGSGGLDGMASLAGRLKPMARGYANNTTPVLIDATNLIYQVSNGPATISAIYEGGWGGSIAQNSPATTTDIVNASVGSGKYIVQSGNLGTYIKLGSKPVYAITLDVVGAWPSTASPTNVLDVVRQVLTEDCALPSAWIDSGWSSASNAAQYAAGWYWDGSASVTGQQAVDTLLAGLGLRLMPTRRGTLLPLRIAAGTARMSLTTDHIVSLAAVALDDGLDPPAWRWRVGYQHNFTVMSSGSGLHPQATAAQQAYVVQSDQTSTWSSADVLRRYRVPNDPAVLVTALHSQSDASTCASSHGALWGVQRRAWAIELPRHLTMQLELGDTISIAWPTPGLADGQTAIVIGEEIRSDQATSTLLVLAGNF